MGKNVKILRVFSSLGIGGVQKQFLQIVATGTLNAYEINVCSFSDINPLENDYKQYNVKVFKNISRGKYHPLTLWNLCKIIKNNGYRIIHVSKMEDIIPVTFLAAKICNSTLLIQYHFPYSWNSQRKKLFDRICAKISDCVISVSRFVDTYMTQNLELYETKRAVIYNGYSEKESPQEVKRRKEFFKAIMISRLVKFKKVEDLIEAFRLIKNYRKDLKITIIGTGKEKEKLRRLATELPDIEWTGPTKNVEKYLKESDLGVLTSVKEGFGNVIVEYMANCVPPIVSDIPPVSEITPSQHTSLKFPPRDIRALTQRILRLMEEPKLRKKISKNALLRSKQFSIQKTAQNLNDVYAKNK